MGASPTPERWAKAAGLECDHPAPQVKVKCVQTGPEASRRGPDQGTPASHCFKVLTVTSSGCGTQAALQVFPRASGSAVVGIRDGMCCAHSAAGHSQAAMGNSWQGKELITAQSSADVTAQNRHKLLLLQQGLAMTRPPWGDPGSNVSSTPVYSWMREQQPCQIHPDLQQAAGSLAAACPGEAGIQGGCSAV